MMTALSRMVPRALSEKTKAPTKRVPMIVHFSATVGNGCSAVDADMKSVPTQLYRRLDGAHFVVCLPVPLRGARAVLDRHSHGQPCPQVWPALVLLDQDAHRHALHHVGELTRRDVSRYQREIGAGGLVDPHDPAAERLAEGDDVQVHRV